MDRLLGVETEYAFGVGGASGVTGGRVRAALEALMHGVRTRLATLPDDMVHGVFLQNGARLYVDHGGHPEVATPECANPWDVVRYIRAGETILLDAAASRRGRRAGAWTFYRCNVDYSGTGSTWGCHESYRHLADPRILPEQLIPHLVSRLVHCGAGGFDNLSPGLRFTLSPRTAHLACDVSSESTCHRGIFHTRDEPLSADGAHRLHVLCGESLCSDLAAWLKVGTTALVVALIEAGGRPGDGVRLTAPVGAMRRFASDPTCTAVAQTASGRTMTALEIQRHYLEQVEAHLPEPFMPPWAGEVCRRWREVLDALQGGWAPVATRLDWAIKLALYREHARRAGLEWETLEPWTLVVTELTAALKRRELHGQPLTAALVRDRRGPLAAEVRRLGETVLRVHGLRWDDLATFLQLRSRLFEIDTRFGQLGGDGIFSALDAGGVLGHAVDGVDAVAHAVEHPPTVPRATLRGQLIRELAGKGVRYLCDWDEVVDTQASKRIDLGDPFAAARNWEDCPQPAHEGFGAGIGRRLAAWRSARSRPDPIELNQAALELRRQGELGEAEALLRQAIEIEDAQVPADSPKRGHRRNNLAMVLLRAGELDEAARWNAEAWTCKTGQHDLTSGRILFVRVAVRLLRGDREVGLHLGQLKTLLGRSPLACLGDIATMWDIPDVLQMLQEQLPADDADLLAALADTLNDRDCLQVLETFPPWRDAAPAPLDAPWPPG
jgi:hypothetical protein